MKLVFLGTPGFAAVALKRLVDYPFRVAGVITQPDRPKGRSSEAVAPPVKLLAEQCRLKVFQPEKINSAESAAWIRGLAPDLAVVVSYGQIISGEILGIPPRGCINVHSSVLPAYRGAAPINYALLNGDEVTGVTIMKMTERLDAGPVYAVRRTGIGIYETAEQLSERLARLGADLLVDVLARFKEGNADAVPQNEEDASYAPCMKKEDGLINWNLPAIDIHNTVRGFQPWPGAFCWFKTTGGKPPLKVRLIETRMTAACPEIEGAVPGDIVEITRNEIFALASQGSVSILKIQPENKNIMRARDFVNGYRVKTGDRFVGEK